MPLFLRETTKDSFMFSLCLGCACHACLKVPTIAPKYLSSGKSSPCTNGSGTGFDLHPQCDFESYTYANRYAKGGQESKEY